jgi:AraC-like DNA-binding protein
MESLFFNTPNQRYKISKLFKGKEGYIQEVDISNGIFFYNISTKIEKAIELKSIDRMLMIVAVKSGEVKIFNKIDNLKTTIKEGSIDIFISTRQDFTLSFRGDIFIIFIADFFFSRYLSGKDSEPVDYIYKLLQNSTTLKLLNSNKTDALSLYIIEKIVNTNRDKSMQSIRCMYRVMEFLTHRLSFFSVVDKSIDKEDLEIANKAKDYLLKDFKNPPTIKELARLCATNESKLKSLFKAVHSSTIYGYIKHLRLQKANMLLIEENMSIKEVATEVGYRHQGHFSKLFFNTFGVYPKDLK